LNFLAVCEPYLVKRSVGIEVDVEMVERARTKWEAVSRTIKANSDGDESGERVHFLHADLMQDDDIDLTDCTVLTMYFVEEALLRLRPMLERALSGSGCRVVTNGYAMPGWTEVESTSCMGLPLYLYIL